MLFLTAKGQILYLAVQLTTRNLSVGTQGFFTDASGRLLNFSASKLAQKLSYEMRISLTCYSVTSAGFS